MKQESGRSMIEMLGVLAIMGIITGGAALMITSAMRMQKQNSVTEQVLQIVNNVRQLAAEHDDLSFVNNSITFDAIGMKNKNPYGGVYELSMNPSNSRQFVVSITGLSETDCKALLAKGWSDSIGGATGSCNKTNNDNVVQIVYGE